MPENSKYAWDYSKGGLHFTAAWVMRHLIKTQLNRAEQLRLLALDTLRNGGPTVEERDDIESCLVGLDLEIKTLKFQARACHLYADAHPAVGAIKSL